MKPQGKKNLSLLRTSLELFRDNLSEARETTKKEVITPFSQEIIRQITGIEKSGGELLPGQSIDIKSLHEKKAESHISLNKQNFTLETTLREEEKVLVEKKNKELRLQIEAIRVEVSKIAAITPQLSREVEIASLQAPGTVGVYEVFFLRHLFDFIKSFREKIQESQVWLASVNRRAKKKNVWGENYKKHGAKYLLSGEHYSSRSGA